MAELRSAQRFHRFRHKADQKKVVIQMLLPFQGGAVITSWRRDDVSRAIVLSFVLLAALVLAFFVILAPAVARTITQAMLAKGDLTCGGFAENQKKMESLGIPDASENLMLRSWETWRQEGFKVELERANVDAEAIADGVAIYCMDPDHAAVTWEQATLAIYAIAVTPAQDGAALQREAKKQALIQVMTDPSATDARRWVAAHELLLMDRR
jgi:hypothetical protein